MRWTLNVHTQHKEQSKYDWTVRAQVEVPVEQHYNMAAELTVDQSVTGFSYRISLYLHCVLEKTITLDNVQ